MRAPFTREQRTTIVYGILCVVLVIVVLQLWLLTATMNAYLGGDDEVVMPAAVASVVCFGLNTRAGDNDVEFEVGVASAPALTTSSMIICSADFCSPSRSTSACSGRRFWLRPAAVMTAFLIFTGPSDFSAGQTQPAVAAAVGA